MAGKGRGKANKRPKTSVAKKPGSNDKSLLDADRPITAPSPDEQAAFLQLKYEIYGMSLYQQIAPAYTVSYFPTVTMAAMKKASVGGGGGASKGKGKGKKGKKK